MSAFGQREGKSTYCCVKLDPIGSGVVENLRRIGEAVDEVLDLGNRHGSRLVEDLGGINSAPAFGFPRMKKSTIPPMGGV